MTDSDVLIAGAGPIGLTAAIELRRHGVRTRIVDPLLSPPQYAKAVGVQPRTLEIFEGMGVLGEVLTTGTEMRGQIIYVNGTEVGRIDLELPPDIPFRFLLLPQYETERILRDRLAATGVTVERGISLTGFQQDDDGVTAELSGPDGTESVRTGYLLGADGAHSTVRKALGLTFEGAAFADQYMLGDVEVDWNQPTGYAVRSMHQTDGETDDVLVCIPLPGRGRYRMSMLVPDDLAAAPATGDDAVAHGFEGERAPELSHIQAVLDRLAPEPATARNLRWSSVFRISHRIVDSYGKGRVFVAGDAAHIHPPTGAQGMNTGIQDAHNLAWKLALAVAGNASDELLSSYDAERRPVGEEVVGRTVRNAREGIGADSTDVSYVMKREAQLLIDYFGSPILGDDPGCPGPRPGQRAPDAAGLRRAAVSATFRLFPVLDRVRHTALLYADAGCATEVVDELEAVADLAATAARQALQIFVIAAPGSRVEGTVLPVLHDEQGEFASAYLPDGPSIVVIRPDGYLGHRGPLSDRTGLLEYLTTTFGGTTTP